jgi:zinc protease
MSRMLAVAAVCVGLASLTSPVASQDSAATAALVPASGPARPYNFPTATRFALGNGVKVIVLERHALPVVSASILVDAGALREPAVTSGVASLTGSLLSSGTRSLTGLAKNVDEYVRTSSR